jgi:hypothetical protein
MLHQTLPSMNSNISDIANSGKWIHLICTLQLEAYVPSLVGLSKKKLFCDWLKDSGVQTAEHPYRECIDLLTLV